MTGDSKPLVSYTRYWYKAFKPLSLQFEYQQAQLELEIENLSWKVERAESTDVAELRQQMSTAEVKRLTLLRDLCQISDFS